MNDNIQLYFYNGMQAPEKIDINDIQIDSNYLGDVTDTFISEYKEMLDHYTLKEMIDNQPLAEYDVFINPTKKQLQGYNRSILLDDNQYLEDFSYIYN